MNRFKFFGWIILCFLLVACGTTGKVLKSTYCASVYGCGGKYHIEDPSKRIENACLSVLPPQEEGWSVVRKQGWWIKGCDTIFLGKENFNTKETTLIHLMPFELPEFETTEEFFAEMKKHYQDINQVNRYEEVLSFDQGVYQAKDSLCSMHSYLVKDTGIPDEYEKEYMYLQSMDINCPINWKPLLGGEMGVRFSYSRRYNSGDDDPEFREKALRFFDQVQFLD